MQNDFTSDNLQSVANYTQLLGFMSKPRTVVLVKKIRI